MRKKVGIISFGLDHVKRGVESNALILFKRLSEYSSDIYLIKGSGHIGRNQIIINSIKRNSIIAQILGKVRADNVYWESLFFIFPLIFHVLKMKYTVVYTQERMHAKALFFIRKIVKEKFKIVYCEAFQNDNTERLNFADVLQEINLINLKSIKEQNLQLQKTKTIKYLPHFYDITCINKAEPRLINELLEFKGNNKLLLFVGDHDHWHKNFRYLLNEFQNVREEWVLLGCGDCSFELLTIIKKELGCRYKNILVNHDDMPTVYKLADLFILPSLDEGFGISIIEAFAYKLPVLLHNNEHFCNLTKDNRQHIDMTKKGALTNKLSTMYVSNYELTEMGKYNHENYECRYSWNALSGEYLELFELK